MIAGQLPADPATLSPGSGPVDIYNNLIQGNLANDDGGGIRFLMAGNFPMNVYNNMIVNNVSTHEGGGIGLNDAPDVAIYSNTIMKNITTATAVTSNGFPAPAGLSTSANSNQLQAVLPGGSPAFSDPILFNNIFWDNRAGTRGLGTVTGLGAAGDATPINNWDLGVADGTGTLSPIYSIIQAGDGAGAATNSSSDPQVVSPYDTTLTFAPWRTNPNFVGAIMVTVDNPPNLLGDYHIQPGSPAVDAGVAGTGATSAPAYDIDNQGRPGGGAFDIGADEIPSQADLSITKTDGLTSVQAGSAITYTIVVTNNGPSTVTGAAVTDSFPSVLTGVTWTCTASAGSVCVPGSGGYGNGSINGNKVTLSLLTGGSATFSANATVSLAATGTLSNTASVTAGGATDPNPGNNSATDTTTITAAFGLLDNFNRANVNNLGANWSQANTGTNVDIRVNSNQAVANQTNDGGQAIWNPTVFGASQAAAFTFANTTVNNAALILKASGGTATAPTNFVRVRYQTGGGGQVLVQTTANGGGSYTTRGTLSGVSFASGDILSATAGTNGSVTVYKNGAPVGSVSTSAAGAWTSGGGWIGVQLQTTGVRIDNFSGGTLP
jgi:uncharacterized repeat protein (TIGR01451 family)